MVLLNFLLPILYKQLRQKQLNAGNLLEGDQYKDAIHWLHTHAHEYGFIVRFQQGKEAITGYIPEAWHLRYIGDKATDIYNSGLSLEEYFGVAGGDYE